MFNIYIKLRTITANKAVMSYKVSTDLGDSIEYRTLTMLNTIILRTFILLMFKKDLPSYSRNAREF